ncbi:MAG: N-acetylmuramoyl-L-alanine amidase [Thermoanaerobaculia bacterium]
MLPVAAAAQPSIARDVRVATSGAPAIVAAEAPFEAAAVSWRETSGTANVRVRASSDRSAWTPWIDAPIDHDLTDADGGRRFTGIVHFGASQRYLEYAFDSAEPAEATVTLFAPPDPSVRALEVEQPLAIGPLRVRSRVEWGCPDGAGARWKPAYTRVTHAVVHHTAGANDLPDWDAEVRNIWHYHTVTRGWGDIGYNYLITPTGVVYEGRAGGLGAIGAHFSCRNTNTVGIAILGTYSNGIPRTEALDALTRLVGALTSLHGIDPDAFAIHAPTTLLLPVIPGHRDANSSGCSTTECPGDALYSWLPILRSALGACEMPEVTSQPISVTIERGGSATLTVSATGSEPAYQWYTGKWGRTESPIAGATSPSLTVSPSSTTRYWVRVSSVCGSADSADALVIVPTEGRRRAVGRP